MHWRMRVAFNDMVNEDKKAGVATCSLIWHIMVVMFTIYMRYLNKYCFSNGVWLSYPYHNESCLFKSYISLSSI